jgi:hypothetical protein
MASHLQHRDHRHRSGYAKVAMDICQIICTIMKVRILFASLSMILAAQAFAADLPVPSLTPGAIDPSVTQQNIQSTICVKGYTRKVRPPASYTNKLKKWQIREYGYADTDPRHYEEDHLIPLEIGGDPRDPRNLWPEPRRSQWNAKEKDRLENLLHREVCDGEIPLTTAQAEIAHDWISADRKYIH